MKNNMKFLSILKLYSHDDYNNCDDILWTESDCINLSYGCVKTLLSDVTNFLYQI
jgi:hypothetical protein